MSEKAKKQKSAGAKIIEGLTELRETLEEAIPIEERFTVRTVAFFPEPNQYDAETVRETREMLRMSQAVFARFLGVDERTLQSWEQGLRKPSPIARRFMDEIRHNPGYWIGRFREEPDGPALA